MFGKQYVKELVEHSTDNETDRRLFLKGAGAAGLGALGVAALGSMPAGAATPRARADRPSPTRTQAQSSARAEDESHSSPSDGAILNFALNLEYLEGEYYHQAAYGKNLPHSLTGGKGERGKVTGGREVNFKSKVVKELAHGIAADERDHVAFLRAALGQSKVAMPHVDIKSSFTAAARAAGVIGPHQHFDPYANENNFLLGAFIFEDVGVTAYKGAAPLINNKDYLEAAAGILAVEAYHAAAIRTLLFERGLGHVADKISAARDSLDGKKDDDRGVFHKGVFDIAPTNRHGIAYSRSPGAVLNIVYLTPHKAKKGGFFPNGVHGSLDTSESH